MSISLRNSAAPAAVAALLALIPIGAQPRAAAPPAPVAPQPGPADWRTLDPENTLVIDTTRGRVVVEMHPDVAPTAVERIKVLTRRGFYDGQSFFRVIDTFMAQTGDPQNNGKGQSELPNLKGQFSLRRGPEVPFVPVAKATGGSELGFVGSMALTSQSSGLMDVTADGKVNAFAHFCPGVAGMAKSSDPDSANSQFFLMRQTDPTLDGKYAAWGRVVSGLAVVRALTVGEPPAFPDKMNKVRVAADMPAAERPNVRVLNTASPAFRASIDAARASNGADFSPCDVDVPSQGS